LVLVEWTDLSIALMPPLHRVRMKLAAARKRAAKLKTGGHHHDWLLQNDVRLFEKMEQLCKADGHRLRNILEDDVSGLNVEASFSAVSRIVLRKDLFHSFGNLFDYAFTPLQKKMVAYLIWQIVSKYNRRTRQKQATFRITGE